MFSGRQDLYGFMRDECSVETQQKVYFNENKSVILVSLDVKSV